MFIVNESVGTDSNPSLFKATLKWFLQALANRKLLIYRKTFQMARDEKLKDDIFSFPIQNVN